MQSIGQPQKASGGSIDAPTCHLSKPQRQSLKKQSIAHCNWSANLGFVEHELGNVVRESDASVRSGIPG